ncbi:hypothetical protein F5X96DRAFT_669265 [Biscogniauxia mediterranea]|nr:hypothetical protein F5X96DRAFT_669265 [Biscogniauxia mediterranea]
MAFLKTLLISLFAVTAAWAIQPHHRHDAAKRTDAPTTTSSIDYAKISEQLHSYVGQLSLEPVATRPSVTLGISVPETLRAEIISAVPASIIIKLVNPQYRASVAADFAAGNTPGWYQSLPPDVKTFFEGMAKDIRTGSAVFTVTSTPTPTATAEGGDAPVITSSSDMAMPTGADRGVMASVVGMAGVLGVVLVL